MKLPHLNRIKTFCGFCSFIFYFFQASLLSAQSFNGKPHNTDSIFLASGALVYSNDIFFNGYLSHSTTVGNDITVKVVNKKENKLIVSVKKKNGPNNYTSLTDEFKKTTAKKKEREIAAIKKQVTQYKKRKLKFKQDNINLPYSSFFQASHHGNWNYIIPSTDSQKYFVADLSEYIYSEKISLHYLYLGFSSFYNSKIIRYCFSTIHSVRPPPKIL